MFNALNVVDNDDLTLPEYLPILVITPTISDTTSTDLLRIEILVLLSSNITAPSSLLSLKKYSIIVLNAENTWFKEPLIVLVFLPAFIIALISLSTTPVAVERTPSLAN